MRLFTPAERRILQFLMAFFLIGLVVNTGRNYWTQPGHEKLQGRQKYLESFRAGAINYRESKNTTELNFPSETVNINQAGTVDLQVIRGIGPVLAKKIIDYRSKNGYFQTVQELVKVDGIGPKMVKRWENQLIVESDTAIIKDSPGE